MWHHKITSAVDMLLYYLPACISHQLIDAVASDDCKPHQHY